MLDVAVAAAPRFSRQAERLRGEHVELRSQMQAVLSAANGADWARAHEVFVALHRALGDHERAEEEILRSAYLDDLGGGD